MAAVFCSGMASYLENEEDKRCRACHSQSLRVDWAQGDRVCTNCGVVDEGRLRDDRPEWREFNDAEDLVKGLPAAARSGLVRVDEEKYLGGLQPTSLSKHVWGPVGIGKTNRQEESRIRKQLNTTNRKLDFLMEKKHSKAIKDARLSRLIKLKAKSPVDQNDEDIRPEYDEIVMQEEKAKAELNDHSGEAYQSLQLEKWSLDRAILLHGSDEEQSGNRDEERENLLSRLDKHLKKASSDLYKAYKLVETASRKLELPNRVLHDCVDSMCKYAAQKEGFRVKGVASRLSGRPHDKVATARLREFNSLKQVACLGSALLFLMARKHGATRSINQVCSSFKHPHTNGGSFVKSKHCTKAMNELRLVFPDMMRSMGTISGNTGNFVEHTLRKLSLPPVASSSIQTLVEFVQKEEGVENSKLSTVCASVAFFVCMAGELMQRLAQQSGAVAYSGPNSTKKRKRDDNDTMETPPLKVARADKDNDDEDDAADTEDEEDIPKGQFDIFTHKAVRVNTSGKSDYEMRRMWDAWSEQISWARSSAAIEQACGVSRGLLIDFYKTKLYPHRDQLLRMLRDHSTNGSLRDTPRAASLLSNIGTAAALMNAKGKI